MFYVNFGAGIKTVILCFRTGILSPTTRTVQYFCNDLQFNSNKSLVVAFHGRFCPFDGTMSRTGKVNMPVYRLFVQVHSSRSKKIEKGSSF